MNSRRFEVLEHTADIGIRAFGETLGELFANAAWGVQDIAFDAGAIQPHTTFQLSAAGEDTESLLVNWLNEVIFYVDARHTGFSDFDVRFPSEGTVAATAWGEKRDLRKHPARLVVKAATYHLLRVAERNDGWMAEVYLDI
jgi:SHS2 domain-containing protein